MPHEHRDAELMIEDSLPGAGASVAFGVFDLGNSRRGDFVARCELMVEWPAMTTLELPDTESLTWVVEHGDAADVSDAAAIATGTLATGADGAGSPPGKHRLHLPLNVKRFVRVTLTNSGAGDPSAKTATVAIVF